MKALPVIVINSVLCQTYEQSPRWTGKCFGDDTNLRTRQTAKCDFLDVIELQLLPFLTTGYRLARAAGHVTV